MRHILNRFINLVISLVCLPSLVYANGIGNTAPFDDWVCSEQSQTLCHGNYLQEPLPFPGQTDQYLKTLPITITSDQAEFRPDGNSTLTGHVHLTEGNRQLFANHATIHRDPRKTQAIDFIQADGHVKITEPDMRVDGTHAEVLVEKNTQVIQDATYRLYDRHSRGTATSITVYDKKKMVLKKATYTTCAPFQRTWFLKAENVALNKKTGRGRARHTRLYVYDVPVFYFPYLDFPIDNRRQTGFLFPSYGSSNRSGVEIGAPFYWNIAPNYDATLTPTLYSERGLEFKGQFRYLLANSAGELDTAILPNDRKYRTFKTQSLANPFGLPNNDPRIRALNTNNTREFLRAKHTTRFNEHLTTNLLYQTVGDDNYFMDFGNTLGSASTTQLLQQGDLLFQAENWTIQTRLQQYQTLHPFSGPVILDVYKRLPQISLQNSYLDLPCGLEWTTQGEFSHFDHKKDPLTNNAFTVGDRFQLRPGLSLPISAPGWFVKPRIQADFLGYSLKRGLNDRATLLANTNRLLPIFDFDSGLVFEREFSLKKEPYLQTLEPRAYYLYVPYRNQNALPIFDTSYPGFDYNQLYRENRFTGLDRLGDANQVTLGITSRFIAEETGRERLNLTAGQIFYFKNRQVTICNPTTNPMCLNQEYPNGHRRAQSSFIGLARLNLVDHWSLSGNAEWDPYQKQMDKEAIGVQYQPDERSVVNLGYQFLRQNLADRNPITGVAQRLDQTDTSVAWPLTQNWRVLGRWHYDLHNRRSNETLMGIEHQGCCTAVRLVVSRFLEPFDNTRPNNSRRYAKAVFLQFVFKGLGGVGNSKVNSTLQRIPGYRWRDNEY